MCAQSAQNKSPPPTREPPKASPVRVSVCLSVCPSVTFVHCNETSDNILKLFPTILALPYETLWQYSDADLPLKAAPNAGGVWKNRDLRPMYRFILEVIQDRAICCGISIAICMIYIECWMIFKLDFKVMILFNVKQVYLRQCESRRSSKPKLH